MQDTTKNNALIAEFMGGFLKDSKGRQFYKNVQIDYPENFEFDTSWDWLMPVVEKIESMGFSFVIFNNHADVFGYYEIAVNVSKKYECFGIPIPDQSKIIGTYHAVILFITWYNSQPK